MSAQRTPTAPPTAARPARLRGRRGVFVSAAVAGLTLAALTLAGLTLSACGPSEQRDPSADAARPVDATPVADLAPGAPDLGGRRPGEACTATVSCAAGRCLHGLCSLDCTADAACPPGQHCAERGGGRLCTPTCDADAACAEGQRCVADAPGRGFCVARGAGAAGSACTGPEDCASWFCAQGTCLAHCAGGADCGAGTTCLALHVGGVCTETGTGTAEAPCARGAECRSGVCRGGGCAETCDATAAADPCANDRHCVAYASLSLCERGCAEPADCGAFGLCLLSAEGSLCRTRGTGAAGSPCVAATECRSGHCTLGACAAECAEGCPPATACVHDVTGATCRAAGTQADNSPCMRGEECRSGFCAAGRCGRDCAEGNSCPAGLTCVGFAEGRFCFPVCSGDADCESTAFCARELADVPVCFWRGAAPEGSDCSEDFECVSGLCRGGQCLGACQDGRCSGDHVCRDFRHGAFCTHLPAPDGAECYTDAECISGLRCTAGRCLPACEIGCPTEASCPPGGAQCTPTCGRDADCGPGFVCQRHDGATPYCAPRGDVPLHGVCTRGPECRSGLCHGGRCAADCPACNVGSGGGVEGAPCAADAECTSGLCVVGLCARTCPESGCGAGRVCGYLGDARVCVPTCAGGDLPCPPGLFCVVDASAGLVCRGPRAGAPAGGGCASAGDCAADAPVCRQGQCRSLCNRDADCHGGTACRTLPDDVGVCVAPGEAPLMAACTADAECASGLCEGGRCFGACAPGCAGDARCVDAARQPAARAWRCAPACEPQTRCPEGTQCRVDAEGRGACY